MPTASRIMTMFCPRCKAEYRAGFTRCTDCDVDLVHEVEENNVEYEFATEENCEVVATVSGPLEEAQIRSFLTSHDIPNALRKKGFQRLYGVYHESHGAVQILVPLEFAAQAKELLKRADGGEF